MTLPAGARRATVGVLAVVAVCVVTAVLNETPVLYFPAEDYAPVDEASLASPEFAPFRIDNPDSDDLIIVYHGYTSSPLAFRHIAEHFSENYSVVVPIYPGHGTTREDFKRTSFSQWYAHARDVYVTERERVRNVYICGHSMGGLITLRLAEEFSGDAELAPRAAITISAPVFENNLLGEGVVRSWQLYLVRYASWVLGEFEALPNPADPDGAPQTIPGDYIDYEFPGQIYSLKMGMRDARVNLEKISVPMLLMHARGDRTVPYENLFFIADHISSWWIEVRTFDLRGWEHNRHSIQLYDSTTERVISEIEGFLSELHKKGC